MKHFKRLISVILALLMIISGAPLSALAAESQEDISGHYYSPDGEEYDLYWSYTASTDTLYLDGEIIGSMQIGDVQVLPLYYRDDNGDEILWTGKYSNVVFSKNVVVLEECCLGWDYIDRDETINISFERSNKLKTISAYALCEYTLDEVIIPDTVNYIGEDAFEECYINYLRLPDNTENVVIKDAAFFKSTIEEFDFNSCNITEISDYAFSYANLNIFVLPEGIQRIGKRAFSMTSFAKPVVIPSTVQTIDEYAFYTCRAMSIIMPKYNANKKITINAFAFNRSVIDEFDFNGCNLVQIPSNCFTNATVDYMELSNNTTEIYAQAFYNATINCNLKLPDNLVTIGSKAFYNAKIDKVIFPNPHVIERIESFAFAYCTVKEDSAFIAQTDHATWIANNAFNNTNIQIKEPEIPEDLIDTEQHSVSGFFDYEDNDYDLNWSYNASSDTLYLDAKIIKTFEFYKEHSLPLTYKNNYNQEIIWRGTFHKVVFSNKVKELEENCLGVQDWDEWGYVSVEFEANSTLEKIGYCAFEYASIKRMIIPDSVYYIDHAAFFESKLEYVKMPNYQGDKEIVLGEQIFAYCPGISVDMEESSIEEISASMFENSTITGLTLPETLKKIGNEAFYFSNIDFDLHFPNSLETVGNGAFKHANIKNVYFGSSLKKLNENAFNLTKFASGCTVHFSSSASNTVIGESAFARSNIESINIPASIGSFEGNAFMNCTSLKTVTFGRTSRLKSLGTGTFKNCTKLEEIIIPAYVEEIGINTFMECTKLSSVVFRSYSNLKTIGESAFYKCTALEEIDLPLSIEEIQRAAFQSCSALTEIIIPASCQTIGAYAFNNCTMLETAEFEENSILETIGDSAFMNCKVLSEISLPQTTKAICKNAFKYCYALESIYLPNSIETLELGAFRECTSLKTANIPNSIAEIAGELFMGDAKLEMTIPASIYKVGVDAFRGCSKIKNVPRKCEQFCDYSFYQTGIEEIDFSYVDKVTLSEFAFSGCTKLTRVNFANAEIDYYRTSQGIFSDCTALKDITLSDSMTAIPSAFLKYSGIEQIELPRSIRSIYSSAFEGSMLQSITITNNITAIQTDAFKNCLDLSCVTFEERNSGLTLRGDEHFMHCISLEDISLPLGISTIPKSCFFDAGLKTVDIPDSVVKIDVTAFYNTKLTTVNLPDSLQTIEPYAFCESTVKEVNFSENSALQTIDDSAFYQSKLERINLPNSLTTIGQEAFACTNLSLITLGENCTSIGYYAFEEAPLQSVTVLNKNLDLTGTRLFAIDCDYRDDGTWSLIFNKEGVIYGYKGSKAEEYANTIECVFVELESDDPEEPEPIPTNELSGTWSNGEWSIETNTYKTLYIYGNGSLENANPVNSAGVNIAFKDIANQYEIEKLYIGDGITEIPDYFMYDESGVGVSLIRLPNSLESIGDWAFAGCSVTKFYNAVRLSEISNNNLNSYIPKNVNHIGKYAFAYTDSLSYEFVLPKEITEISEGLFYNSNVKNVSMFGKVKKIGKKAFANCANMTSLYVPCSVTDIYSDGNLNNNGFGFVGGSVSNDLWVIGRKDSYAHQYCKNNNINYSEHLGLPYRNGILTDSKSTSRYRSMYWEYYIEDDYLILYSTNDTIEMPTGNYSYREYNSDLKSYSDGKIITGSEDIFLKAKNVYIDRVKNFTAPLLLSYFEPKEVKFSSFIRSIGEYTLKNCTDIEEIEFPDAMNFAGKYAFTNCKSLKKVRLGKTITNVSEGLFSECRNLESIDLGNVILKSIGPKAFYNCSALKFINLKNQTSYNQGSIGDYAFYNCVNLQQINIPDNIRNIGERAFYNCVQVQSITLSSNVQRIDKEAFANLFYCENITLNSEVNAESVSAERNIFPHLGEYTNGIEVNIGSAVENLDCKFFNGLNITKINLGSSVLSIANKQYLDKLKTITADDNQYLIVKNNCLYFGTALELVPQALTDVTIDESTTLISDYALYGTNAKSVVIPDSVVAIGESCFENSKSLIGVTLSESLTGIPVNAFKNCTKLRLLNLPENIVLISESAFEGCTSLVSVVFNNTLSIIGKNAFRDCVKLEGLAFPENLSSIAEGAFENCTGLKYAYIWYSQIGNNAFNNCPKLNIFTPVRSDAYRYAREFDIPYSAYTDEELFFDEWAIKIDALAGYLGYCEEDGHGEIQYLTVYEADCEHDGYVIGVCEYCSEILEEIHTEAYGHNYKLETEIPATATTKGISVYTCENCKQSYTTYTAPLDDNFETETHTVSGKIELSADKYATAGLAPAKSASIIINGMVVATTDENGTFSFELETGTYEAHIKYAYGFTRTIYIQMRNRDLNYKKPIVIIGCDFSKDGKIDDEDIKLFEMIISAKKNDPSYLSFVDMNGDGYINAKDMLYIRNQIGLTESSFRYVSILIN